MLYRRIENSKKKKQWNNLTFKKPFTYNNKLKTLQLNTHHQKQGKMKTNRNKRTGEKECTSKWEDNSYYVEKISKSLGHNYYKLQGLARKYLKHELLKSQPIKFCWLKK